VKRWITGLISLFVLCSLVIGLVFWGCNEFYPGLMETPLRWMDHSGVLPAMLSISLLGLDVYLPVPSNILLTLNGKFFGFPGGALLNLAGCLTAGVLAWFTGRLFASGTTRTLSLDELFTAQRIVKKWGLLAVVASRPIPILAEAVAVTAAASGMGPGWFAAGIFLGSLPISLVYALAGAYAERFSAWVISFTAVLVVSLGCWLWGRRFVRHTVRDQGADTEASGSAGEPGA
jgi:uncharacterized membrane protein YdjX (TVP38/TMEM64 family)